MSPSGWHCMGGRRAPVVSAVFLSAAAAPPVLSAVCEWRLTSRLFSPRALDSSRDNRVRLGPSGLRRHLLLVLLLVDCIWMCDTAEARPILVWREL